MTDEHDNGHENDSVETERRNNYQAFLLGALSSMLDDMGMNVWQWNFEEDKDAYVFGEMDDGKRFSLNVGFHEVTLVKEEEPA